MKHSNNSNNDDFWQSERVAFCALQSLHGVGFKILQKLVNSVDSLKEFIKHSSPDEFSKTLRIKLPSHLIESKVDWSQYQQKLWSTGIESLKNLSRANIHILFLKQDDFPLQLKKIDSPPSWLFVQGNVKNLYKTAIGIVGSRKCSPDGYWMSKYLHSVLFNKDVVTVSGLAEGIDQSVHRESLRYKIPTIAVLGTGIDKDFPKGSEELRADIVAGGGTVITEYLVGQSYSASNFIQRNRIQAALSSCLIPLEWKIKSGTAHTVNFAKDYNRNIAMLHLPDSATNTAELNSVESYVYGKTFNVPIQTSELTTFLEALISTSMAALNEPVREERGNCQFNFDM